ncbi:MAG: glycosyltransferase family 39 protein [Firmicutes bacterium]|nr:glycosyltransferase family 39 protein [Bacillota bacterium]
MKAANSVAGFLKKIAKPVNIFLILFIVFFVWQNNHFIRMDTAPKETNDQYSRALEVYRVFVTKEFAGMDNRNNYPPLMSFVTLPFLQTFGPSEQAARFSLSVFSVIFLLSMYGIGRYLGDEFSGIAAVFLAASSPHLLNLSRLYYLDFPQTALTALAFYFLLRSENFTNRIFSIHFGLALSAACWIKWSAIFFLAAPLVFLLIPVLVKIRKNNAVYAVVFSAFIIQFFAAAWYYKGISIDPSGPLVEKQFPGWFFDYLLIIVLPSVAGMCLIKYLNKSRKDESEQDVFMKGITNFYHVVSFFVITVMPFYFMRANSVKCRFFDEMTADLWHRNYFSNFYSALYSMGTMFSLAILLMAAGIVFMFVKRRDRLFERFSLIIGLIAGMAVLVKIGHTNLRYYLSFIIFTVPLAVYWFCYLKKYRFSAVVLLFIMSVVACVGLSYGGRYNSSLLVTVPSDVPPMLEKVPVASIFAPVQPDTNKFELDELLKELPEEKPEGKRRLDVRLMAFLAEPQSGIPFGVEFVHEEARKKRIRVRAMPFCMNEPIKEMERTFDNEPGDGSNLVAVVFQSYDSYRNLLSELEQKYGRVEMLGKFVDIGSGYFVRLTRVSKRG